MASELGQPLHELMGWPGPLTHRQFITWQAWLRLEMEVPSRTDHYLMALRSSVIQLPAHVWGKRCEVDSNDLRLTFRREGEPESQVDPKVAAGIAKATWHARLGKPPEEELGRVEVPDKEQLLQRAIRLAIEEDKRRERAREARARLDKDGEPREGK